MYYLGVQRSYVCKLSVFSTNCWSVLVAEQDNTELDQRNLHLSPASGTLQDSLNTVFF